MPGLAAVQMGEAVHHLDGDCAAWRKAAMARPKADGLRSGRLNPLRDKGDRVIPADAAPAVGAAIVANLRIQQALRIAEYLASRPAAHAEKALTDRIVVVA